MPTGSPPSRYIAWAKALILVALIAVVYWPTLDNGLITDDGIYVLGPADFPALVGWTGLSNMWFALGVTPQYYPLVHSAMWVEFQAWGVDPRGYHAMNMLWHAGVSLLLWRLLYRLQVPGAWLAAAIFAVHPVEVESVAWASERKNLMSAALALSSMLAYLRFQPWLAEPIGETQADNSTSGSLWWLALSIVLYLAAMLSKTVVASAPAVLLVIVWWKRGRIERSDWRPLAPLFAVGIAMGVLSVWMERTYVGATGSDWHLGSVERVLIAGRAVWFYAGKLVWPYPLSFLYPRWTIDAGVWWQYLYPAAALALVVLLWSARHRIGRGPLAAALVFGGVLVPALGFFNVFPFVFSFVADHYQYHASMALIALAAAALTLATAKLGAGRTMPWLAAALLLPPLAYLARQETFAYRSEETLFRHAIARYPEAWAAHYDLACTLNVEQRYAEALSEFETAQRLSPGQARIDVGLGDAHAALGHLGAAEAAYRNALAADLDIDSRANNMVHLAGVLNRQGRHAEALELCQQGLKLRKGATDGLATAATALQGLERRDEAVAVLRDWVRIEPRSLKAHLTLAEALSASGNFAAAAVELKSAAELAPDAGALREKLAVAYLQSGQAALAEQELRSALKLPSPTASAHDLLGIVHAQRGDLKAAISEFEAALAIEPDNAGARSNLEKAREVMQQSTGQ